MSPKRKFTLSSLPTTKKMDSAIAKVKPMSNPKSGNMTKVAVPKSYTTRHGGSAPVLVCIHQASELASDLWPELDGADAKLYQVQVKHDGNPSLVFDILTNFKDYLQAASASNPQIPPNLQELASSASIKLVLTGMDDPDSVGYVRWRVAFYVAGNETSLKNFFFLFDGFLKFKADQMALASALEVHVHPSTGIALDMENLEYSPYTMHAAAKDLPMGFFEAHPVIGSKRVSTLNFETETAQTVNIVFSALPYKCRARLSESGVAFDAKMADDDSNRFQIIKGVDAAKPEEVERVISACSSILRKLALRLVITVAPPPDSPAMALLQALRGLAWLHSV